MGLLFPLEPLDSFHSLVCVVLIDFGAVLLDVLKNFPCLIQICVPSWMSLIAAVITETFMYSCVCITSVTHSKNCPMLCIETSQNIFVAGFARAFGTQMGPEKTEPVEEDMPDWLRDAPTQPGLPGPPEPETFDVEMSDQLVGDAVKELLSFSSEQAIANVVENVYLQTSVYHDVEDEAWVNLSMRGRTVCLQKPKYVRDDTQVGDLSTKEEADAFAKTQNVKILRWFVYEGDQHYMILLVYVDDLMIGVLSVDGKVEFLGRRIRRDQETGDLRKILDDGVESQQTPLSPEASSNAVEKIAWCAQTRIDLTYFISVLNPPEPWQMARVSLSLSVGKLPCASTCARYRRPNKHIHCRAAQSFNVAPQDGNRFVGETIFSLSYPDHFHSTHFTGSLAHVRLCTRAEFNEAGLVAWSPRGWDGLQRPAAFKWSAA
ncbi:hypothetical protein AK812_SmicGene42546 [Symbiodinium microadriaticum]|uniref:Uncharacterized protein n=1 Tax=Symbiodinium microadriaticum TaxID=2951 RepID=A0A1Q9C398_SYMMI|nr:hypothetical protein AK812_SmicGene42546 [Symbiodinium microadriaticum]